MKTERTKQRIEKLAADAGRLARRLADKARELEPALRLLNRLKRFVR